MKYLGENSVSSWMGAVLKIAWVLGVVATISVTLAVFVLAVAGDAVIPRQLSSGLTITSGGLKVQIMEQYVEPMHRTLFLALLLAGAATGGVVLAIIRNLQFILATFAANKPFCLENSKRLRAMGWILLVWSLIEAASGLALGVMIAHMNTLPGLQISPNLRVNPSILLMAALCFIFAEIFRLGVKLKKDSELTI